MEAINKDLIPVSEIMTIHPHTLSLNDSLDFARDKFEKLKVRHLPVVKNEKLMGILSLTDILRLSFGTKFGSAQYDADEAIFEMLSIDQVMKHKPKTVSPKNSLREVGEILSREEFHALPVVDADKLVGIVTTTDVIKYLLEH
jgi:CBS domain-containing protein